MKSRSARRYALLLLLIVPAAWYISVFHFQFLLIHGESMLPTYRSGSLVLLEKRVDRYERGDVVLFRAETLGRSVVKRIGAVPGDRIDVVDNALWINGSFSAPLPEQDERAPFLSGAPFTIPEGYYFMLGDNLSYSIDSRFAQVGLIARDQLRGRVLTH